MIIASTPCMSSPPAMSSDASVISPCPFNIRHGHTNFPTQYVIAKIGPIVTGLLIHTGMIAAGRDVRIKVANTPAITICNPIVGVNATNTPMDEPIATSCGVARNFTNLRNQYRGVSHNRHCLSLIRQPQDLIAALRIYNHIGLPRSQLSNPLDIYSKPTYPFFHLSVHAAHSDLHSFPIALPNEKPHP